MKTPYIEYDPNWGKGFNWDTHDHVNALNL